jgi:hypothetical protein
VRLFVQGELEGMQTRFLQFVAVFLWERKSGVVLLEGKEAVVAAL